MRAGPPGPGRRRAGAESMMNWRTRLSSRLELRVTLISTRRDSLASISRNRGSSNPVYSGGDDIDASVCDMRDLVYQTCQPARFQSFRRSREGHIPAGAAAEPGDPLAALGLR